MELNSKQESWSSCSSLVIAEVPKGSNKCKHLRFNFHPQLFELNCLCYYIYYEILMLLMTV